MIEPEHSKFSISRQCELLGISRSGYYYTPCPVDEYTLTLMNLIDQQYTKTPYYGTRRMSDFLRNLGYNVDRKRVRRLYKLMGLVAICRKKCSNIPSIVKKHDADRYYKAIRAKTQLVTMLFGILSRCDSMTEIREVLRAMGGKLNHLRLDKSPAKSTASDGLKSRFFS